MRSWVRSSGALTVKDLDRHQGVLRNPRIFKGRTRPDCDATSVASAKAGGILLAKTNLPEFSYLGIESGTILLSWALEQPMGSGADAGRVRVAVNLQPSPLACRRWTWNGSCDFRAWALQHRPASPR